MKRNHSLGVALVMVVALAMILAVTPTSTAVKPAEPVTVTGTLTLTGVVEGPTFRTADGNTFITMHSTWNVDGDLVGSFDCYPRATMFSTGESFVADWGLYAVTYGDNEGTIRVRNTGWMGDGGLYHLDSTIVGGGTGDLAKLRGHGSVDLNFKAGTAVYSFDVFWA